ncbi:hypothetical protein ACFQL1_20790 [Halomicroarcula sp. GCM10025709]|uniref:hypothetical protein n=1 Tax=Haloarcula TaxID=2237 RepID=UPI0024C4060D|nr:hypothetical protein [Halomicroarcula sp. YJ-61-S]
MPVVPSSRLVLVLSLVVLGSSIGVFGSVTGLVPDESHRLTIEDGALVTSAGGGQPQVLVEDVRTVSRIEVRRTNGYHVVRAIDREPPAVPRETRLQAQQIVSSAETVGADIPPPNTATYAVRPIPAGLSSDRAAVVGATPNASLRTALAANASAFTVRQQDDTIVFERHESWWSPDRVLVVVTPADSKAQYSVVVDLPTTTVESLVRLDRGDR